MLDKRIYIFIILCLQGCGFEHYNPALVDPIKNVDIYEKDRVDCISDANHRRLNATYSQKGLSRSLFGVAGAAGVVIGNSMMEADDYTKSPTIMVDECLTAKGYKLKK